jgi:hypothetical protein
LAEENTTQLRRAFEQIRIGQSGTAVGLGRQDVDPTAAQGHGYGPSHMDVEVESQAHLSAELTHGLEAFLERCLA